MAQEQTPGLSAEEEIKELERRLEEKKRALESAGSTPIAEREAFREALKEHISSVRVTAPPPPPPEPVPEPDGKTAAALAKDNELKTQAREEAMRALVELALGKSIKDAVREAEASGSPYLIDELHDRLADEYYEKLLALRKIKEL